MKRIFAAALLALTSAVFGATLSPVQLLNPAGSTAGQAIVSTGASSAPAWGGIGVSGIAAIPANTVLANATNSSASPAAFSMASCSTSASALNWTTSTGFTCNTAVNAAQLGGATFSAPGPIGSTTASTGAFTTLSASSTVSGAGFTSLLSPYAPLASPTFTGTPSLPTGTTGITQTAGDSSTKLATTAFVTSSPTINTPTINGVTNGSAAAAGQVGEAPNNFTGSVSLTTNTPANCTSLSLTAGDWDVWGAVLFTPGGTTTIAGVSVGSNTTSATLPGAPDYATLAASFTTGQNQIIVAPQKPYSVSATTTVYLVGQASFGVSTMTCSGKIYARRRR